LGKKKEYRIQCPKCGSYNTRYKTVRANGKYKIYCNNCKRYSDVDLPDDIDLEIVKENVKIAKQRQAYQDTNRIERKSFREHARVENALSEYNQKLIDLLNNYSLATYTIQHEAVNNKGAGIFHFTDPHFNELVEMETNRYDFKVASSRCRLMVSQARDYFKLHNVSNVLFAMTGDLLNSDRRLDELLSQATNRSKATFLAVNIIQQMILDLNQDFNVSVASVTGNESRIREDVHWTEIVATDNYDFTVYNFLKYLFKDCKGVKFLLSDDPFEQVVTVAGKNILLIHGNQLRGSKVERAIQEIKGKYASMGIVIDFVIMGHLHSCRIGDTFSRGSSVVGANDYSYKGLQLTSRASQNIHIINQYGNINSIKIDLQNYKHCKGYPINEVLEAYNAKSADRIRKKRTVFEIVI
jgi:predicted phosphodiesterase